MDEMEFTEAESNMHDLVPSLCCYITYIRLLNINNIRMPRLTRKRNMTTNPLSTRVLSKPVMLQERWAVDFRVNLPSVCALSLFLEFLFFVRRLW